MKKYLILLPFLPFALGGCYTVAAGAATTTGVVVAQERSTGHALDDVTIRTKLNAMYADKDFNDLFWNVDIRVTEGRVLLTGAVKKPDTAVEAVRMAWTVNGVHEVINELQVNDKSGLWDYAKDAWISEQIRTRALLAKDVKSINYNVETVNGIVYLMGIAQDKGELDRITYIARTTRGVQKVISHVRMKDDPRRFK